MFEAKGIVARLDLDFPGDLEHGLEANALLADISLRACLGAFADITYCT